MPNRWRKEEGGRMHVALSLLPPTSYLLVSTLVSAFSASVRMRRVHRPPFRNGARVCRSLSQRFRVARGILVARYLPPPQAHIGTNSSGRGNVVPCDAPGPAAY